MESLLDQLLSRIELSQTIDQTEHRANQALNSFPIDTAIIEEWDEFRSFVCELVCHVENTVLGLNRTRSVNSEFDWGHGLRLLHKEFGPNGEKTAFEMTRSGHNSGLYRVMKVLLRQLVDECVENEIAGKISHFWNQLSTDQRMELADEYLSRFGQLLPRELTEGSAARVRANLPEVLKKHPQMIKRLREVGR